MTPRCTIGVPGLDDILDGGLTPNRLYLLMGTPGVGKTTLAMQFLMEGREKGESGLYVTLSETEQELREVGRSHGWTLDGIELLELSSLDQGASTQPQNTLFHPSEVELNEATQKMLARVDKLRPKRIVFDSLSEMRLLAGDALRYRRQILSLKQYFIGRDCTVMLLDDMTAEASDLQLQSIVHGVIALEQLAPEYGAERRRLIVKKLRGVRFRGGYHDYSIERGGLRVYPRLVASEHHADFKRESLSSGLEELDSLLGGGLDRGTSTVMIGPAGSGKSSISCQFALAALERGEKAAAFTFDENVATFLIRAEGVGIPLRKHYESGRFALRQIDSAELSPGEFAHAVCEAVEVGGARIVIIDSLNGYLNAMPEERFLIIQLHELLTYLAQRGVATMLIVTQHGVLGAMQTPIDVTYVADTVVLTRVFEHQGELHRAMSVTKKRTGPHERTIRELLMSSKGLGLSPPLTDLHGIMSGIPQKTLP